jgi:hypothetical protein
MRIAQRAVKMYGYQPFFGPNLPDMRYAAQIFDRLEMWFPGYRWIVEVRGGLCRIVNESLRYDWGWTGLTSTFDSDGKVIKQIGAGFLERFGLNAGKKDQEEIDQLPTDGRLQCKPLSGGEDGDYKR